MLTTAFRAQRGEKDNLLPHAPDLTQDRGSFLAYFCLYLQVNVCMGVLSRLLYLGSIFHDKVSKTSPQNSLTKVNTHNFVGVQFLKTFFFSSVNFFFRV